MSSHVQFILVNYLLLKTFPISGNNANLTLNLPRCILDYTSIRMCIYVYVFVYVYEHHMSLSLFFKFNRK